MKKTFFLLAFLIFYSYQCMASSVDVALALSPESNNYEENQKLTLLFSCSAKSIVKGSIYIVFVTPGNNFYSLTLSGVKGGLTPFAKNILITDIKNYPVFSFPYLPIFKKVSYKIISVVLDSNENLISNVSTIEIPSENSSNTTQETNNNTTWNSLKTIYNSYIRPFAFKAGKNFLHLFTYKNNYGFAYFKFDNQGDIITANYKIPINCSTTKLPAVVVDNNDNVYMIYYSSTNDKGLYLTKINSKGEVEFTKLFYEWSGSFYPHDLTATISDNTIYFAGLSDYIYDYDKDDYHKKTIYYKNIFLSAVSTEGDIIIKPSPISAQVKEYYNNKKIKETDAIYIKRPAIISDGNGIIHLFWNEKNVDQHTDYYLKYMRFNPSNGNIVISPIAEIGSNESYISLTTDSDNNIYAGFRDSTLTPNKVALIKLSSNGKILKGKTDTTIENANNSQFFLFLDNQNILIAYMKDHNFYQAVIGNNLDSIVKTPEKIIDTSIYNMFILKDYENNFHFISTKFGSNEYLYYTNTINNSNIFKNLPDIVVSQSHFSCSPSNNVYIGKTITCSFKVFNISDNSSTWDNIVVTIDNNEVFSQNIGELGSFESKEFTFNYSPANVNTPEHPSVSIVAETNSNELTSKNNSIAPEIKVTPVPTTASFKIKVYDESYDPDHTYVLPVISDAVCKLYDKTSGALVATALANQFSDIPIGDSQSNKKDYTIKCEKQGYAQATQDVSVWRDNDDPYSIDFSPSKTMPVYMNTWGTLIVDLSYTDSNENEHPLSHFDLYITGKNVNRHIETSYSSETIEDLPAGDYSIKIEKENYEQVTGTFNLTAGGLINKSYITEPTTKGDIKINITSDAGYIPSSATVKFSNSSGNSSLTVTNGEYSGELEKGSYTMEVTASDFETYTKSVTVKAGLTNEFNIELESATPSNLTGYTRGEDIAVVPATIIAKWPSTPVTDGYEVNTLYGVFKINVRFLGEEQDSKIYSLKQLNISVKGLGAYYYSVSSTWDPVDILGLPDAAQDVYDAYNVLPFAVTPEVPIGITDYQGKTKVRIDKIVVKDDKGNGLTEFNGSYYSDDNLLFNVNKVLDDNAKNIITEIYLKVGEEDSTDEFKDMDILDGYNTQYLKLTYTVPKLKPESGWYLYNPVSGNETYITSSYGDSVSSSYLLGVIKYKAFEPYSIKLEYVNPDFYTQNILGISE